MTSDNLAEFAKKLNNSQDYRVLKRYKKPSFYNQDDGSPKLIGVFLDIEATGLSYDQDKLIELGMVKFEYDSAGKIFRILNEFNAYQDPHMPIPEFITSLTGITDDMVTGKTINSSAVSQFLDGVDLIVAHNAQFDRAFFEKTFPDISAKPWACSMFDINWRNEQIESHKLEYIAYKYNFFYEGHRAITDCLVGIHILSQTLYNSKSLALKQMLDNALQLRFRIWAKSAPYEKKDILRSRKYKWLTHPTESLKAWSIELPENKIEEEFNFLKSNIYLSSTDLPVDIFDAYHRFSLKTPSHNQDQYSDKLLWVKHLQS